jgi:hypothetical protein
MNYFNTRTREQKFHAKNLSGRYFFMISFSWLRRGQSHPVHDCRIKTGLSFDVSGFLTTNRMVRSTKF